MPRQNKNADRRHKPIVCPTRGTALSWRYAAAPKPCTGAPMEPHGICHGGCLRPSGDERQSLHRAALRYRGDMPLPQNRARARQWSRTAFAMAAVFGSLPLASRIFLGGWGFDGAAEIGCLCLIAGAYFHIVSRRFPAVPDPATILERAGERAASGPLQYGCRI